MVGSVRRGAVARGREATRGAMQAGVNRSVGPDQATKGDPSGAEAGLEAMQSVRRMRGLMGAGRSAAEVVASDTTLLEPEHDAKVHPGRGAAFVALGRRTAAEVEGTIATPADER